MKKLIIAEKFSVANKIIEALLKKPIKKNDGYFENDDFIVTYCSGHLLKLKYPKEIDSKYEKWSFDHLPIKFEKIPLKVNHDQYKVVSHLLSNNDVDEVVNCCDPDREGELIFRNVYYHSKPKCHNVSRMWTTSVASSEAIIDAYDSRKSSTLYDNLYLSALARSYADYHVGLNATESMTLKFGHGSILKVGRVKTPTLRIIVDIEEKIKNFIPVPFYKIVAHTDQNIDGNYVNDKLDDNRFDNKKDALSMISKVGLGCAKVIDVKKSTRKEPPRSLYNLSDLQIYMNKKYGYSANTVLDACQSLYERHGLTTYPRTSDNKISSTFAKRQFDVIRGLPSMFDIQKQIIINNKFSLNKKAISSDKDIGAHEALTPVPENIPDAKISSLSTVELNVYRAIVERFLSNFYPDAVYESQEITFEKNDEKFKNKIENMINCGHYSAYKDFQAKEQAKFVSLKVNDILTINNLELVEGKTTPPSRLTEGTLIKVMQNPKKYYYGASDEDKKILEETEGLGTEATRSSIIEDLKKGGYIDVVKSKIFATEKGISLIHLIPIEELKSVNLTVNFEKELSLIAHGKDNDKAFLNNIYKLDDVIIEKIKNMKGETMVNSTNNKKTFCKCPKCGEDILEGKFGYYCSNKENCKASIKYEAYSRFGHKKVTSAEAKQLFKNNITNKKVKLISKAGKDYNAYLTWNYDQNAQYPNNCFIKLDNE